MRVMSKERTDDSILKSKDLGRNLIKENNGRD